MQMYYVMSIGGELVQQEVTHLLSYTGEILYQGTSLSEALKIRNRFGQNYDVYTLEVTDTLHARLIPVI